MTSSITLTHKNLLCDNMKRAHAPPGEQVWSHGQELLTVRVLRFCCSHPGGLTLRVHSRVPAVNTRVPCCSSINMYWGLAGRRQAGRYHHTLPPPISGCVVRLLHGALVDVISMRAAWSIGGGGGVMIWDWALLAWISRMWFDLCSLHKLLLFIFCSSATPTRLSSFHSILSCRHSAETWNRLTL